MSFRLQIANRKSKIDPGFTLFELVVTLTVLSILVMGTIPLANNAAKRSKEIRLRETLRLVRQAIDEFKRDTLGACPLGSVTTFDPTKRGQAFSNVLTDPRSRVVIDDCTIFDASNLDRYPPTLDVLVKGVKIRDRGIGNTGGGGLDPDTKQATEITATDEIVKVYLRQMPIDPMTGESDWKFRSSYQEGDNDSWDSINVFDIHSASDEIALNGDKYSDW